MSITGLPKTTGNSPANQKYSYQTVNNQETAQIEKLHYSKVDAPEGISSFDFQYTYDNKGNIASYSSPDEPVTYTHDVQNQQLSANNTGSDEVAFCSLVADSYAVAWNLIVR